MPLFHLNIFDEISSIDDEGLELSDLAAATVYAVQGVRELIAEGILGGRAIHQGHRIEIADHRGRLLKTVRYGDHITLVP